MYTVHWHVMRELNNVHCTLARNEGKKEIPICDWVPARINNVMWWHPSLHERLSTRAKALVVIATTGAQYYYELIICGGSADRSARRRWADKGKKRIWFSIFDVITEPFHALTPFDIPGVTTCRVPGRSKVGWVLGALLYRTVISTCIRYKWTYAFI